MSVNKNKTTHYVSQCHAARLKITTPLSDMHSCMNQVGPFILAVNPDIKSIIWTKQGSNHNPYLKLSARAIQ